MFARPILFFDSGIGGLNVFHATRLKLPEPQFIYVADDKAFPYGHWQEKALIIHILTLFRTLIELHNPLLCVIACNTASTLILEILRETYPDHLFVGTVPAIKPAAEQTASGLVSVLATKGTVERAYTRDLIKSYAKQCDVTLVGSLHLAQYAEDYLQGHEVSAEAVKAEIAPAFIHKEDKKTDIIVLACTHYPFLLNPFRKVAPWPVDWLDPAEAIALQAQHLLKEQHLYSKILAENDNKTYEFHKATCDQAFFTSNHLSFFKQRILESYGLRLKKFT